MRNLAIILGLTIIAVAVASLTTAVGKRNAANVAQTEISTVVEAAPQRGTEVGDIVPEFELTKTDGTNVSLADLRGNAAVIVFWSTYCSACREEAPLLNKLAADYAAQNVKVLGINVDSSDARLNEGIEDFQIRYETVRDPGTKIARSYRVTGTPTVIFLDKNGVVRYHGSELPADYAAKLDEIIALNQ